jgi:hypothetical protein
MDVALSMESGMASRGVPWSWLVAKRPRGKARSAPSLSDEAIDWTATIRTAGEDFAVPALATMLEEAGLFGRAPTDVQDFLRYAVSQNAQANRRIREQCVEIGNALSAVGLHCVLLKGATWLFEDGPAAQDRMLRDIDFLVPRAALEDIQTALSALGYRPSSTVVSEIGHVHDRPLEHPDRLVGVEMHVELTTRVSLLTADDVLAHARRVAPGLFVPSPRHRMVHNAVHAQIINGDFVGGVLSLRDSLDLGRLMQKNILTEDWFALANDARRRGFFRPLSGALHKAAHVSDAALPEPFRSDPAGRRHLRRCLLQKRWPALDMAMRKLGVFHRATAWERDAYALRLGSDRGLRAHLLVNRRRLQRIGVALTRAARPG